MRSTFIHILILSIYCCWNMGLVIAQSLPWPYTREADVASARRIHRIIDVREKTNKELAWTKNHFGLLLWNAVMRGELPAFANSKDSFLMVRMKPEQISKVVMPVMVVQVPRYPEEDPRYDPYDVKDTQIKKVFVPEQHLLKYEVIEDWITDTKSGKVTCRIVAIAPLMDMEKNGFTLPNQPVFWVRYAAYDSVSSGLKYASLRELNTTQKVYDRFKQGVLINFDTYFEKHYYTGTIIKEYNAANYYLRQRPEIRDNPRDIQRESQQIKERMIREEQEIWDND